MVFRRWCIRRSLIVLASFLTYSAHAQLRAAATISLSARLPGYVRLSRADIPVIVKICHGNMSTDDIPVQITWNLDPTVSQAFRITASFRGIGLVQAGSDKVLPLNTLKARLGQNQYRPFMNSKRLVLYVQRISHANREGSEQATLQFQVDSENSQPEGCGNCYALVHLDAEPL